MVATVRSGRIYMQNLHISKDNPITTSDGIYIKHIVCFVKRRKKPAFNPNAVG
jgi:hypothetical protein